MGETLALFAQTRPGVLRSGAGFDFRIGGAESNVAVGLARLGVRATWLGRIGRDPLGDEIVRVLRGEGVEVLAIQDDRRPTGVMIRDRRTPVHASVTYYRTGSAGSALQVSDLDESALSGAEALHTTGITVAISGSAAAAAEHAIAVGRKAGSLVSFDVNFRSRLWTRAAARERLGRLLPHVDLLFAGEDEAALLLGVDHLDSRAAARRLQQLGPTEVVIKRGALGAVAVSGAEEASAPAVVVPVVDTVGAGDAFVAGYLAASLRGDGLADRLSLACATGAMVCATDGDWEGAATLADLELLGQTEPVVR